MVAVDPFDAAAHAALGRMALEAGESQEAVRLFRVALAAGPADKAGAHADLAEGLFAAGDRDVPIRVVTGEGGMAQRLLSITGLDEVLPPYATVEEALTSVSSDGSP